MSARAGTGIPISEALSDEVLSTKIAARNADPSAVVVAPLVSRHFDFLDGLFTGGGLPLSPPLLTDALSGTILLLGSARESIRI